MTPRLPALFALNAAALALFAAAAAYYSCAPADLLDLAVTCLPLASAYAGYRYIVRAAPRPPPRPPARTR